MKDIYTVIIYDDGGVSTVSFLDVNDAIRYATAEIVEYSAEDEAEVMNELEEQLFWSDGNSFNVYIEEAKLCDSFNGKL